MDQSLARRIQESIRADATSGRDVERIGALTATFNRSDDNPYLNYAIPDEGATPSQSEVSQLVERARARGRRPRLEYLPALAPDVEPALLGAGFEVEGRLPLMTCTTADLSSPSMPDAVELVAPMTDDEFEDVALVQWEAYAEAGPVPQRVAAGLRHTAESGGVVILARDVETCEPAGAGLVTAPCAGLAELTSIGVRSTFRRRGIAAAMAAWLARAAFEQGMECVFLMARGDAEARIYERAGFRVVSEVLHISRA